MSMVDRFVCRREGHKPVVDLKISHPHFVTSYITTCARCGQAYEVELPKPAKTG